MGNMLCSSCNSNNNWANESNITSQYDEEFEYENTSDYD